MEWNPRLNPPAKTREENGPPAQEPEPERELVQEPTIVLLVMDVQVLELAVGQHIQLEGQSAD
jgi:hypothetical protein